MTTNCKISILEKVNQMFVCSICYDSKPGAVNTKPFSTSNASLFLEHQRCCHSSVSEFECVYCCSHLPSVNLLQHIQNHFSEPADNRYACPHCPQRIRMGIEHSLDHLEMVHPDLRPECPHCRSSFADRTELQTHLRRHLLPVFHCAAGASCFVKSHNIGAVLGHLKRVHSGSRSMRVECLFTCMERISTKGPCNCSNNLLHSPQQSPLKISSPSGDDCQLIALPYSTRVLSKLSSGFDERLREDLISKMAQYSKFKVRLEIVDGQKQFVCSTCQYRSVHSLADVRKHILGCHCSVSTSYTRLCLRASRLDTNTFSLFSDRKLISFANEKLKRAESGAGWDANGDNSGMQLLEDSEPEQESPVDPISRPVKRSSMIGSSAGSIKKVRLTQRQSHSAKMRPDSPVPEVGQPLERNEKIDRVIHLNYSWHVLERLVAGQCPERYLPILQQKMDVYAMHSILLTRRNGKRYFLCSHCPNCSPHGMNDIRKHILGVHARLPERFKAAAMYCSRMNRDNYGLLSDDELLKKNQDMVRWRAVPNSTGDDNIMEPLPPLQPATCYEDNSPMSQSNQNSNNHSNNSTNNAHNHSFKCHNVFLSGDNGGDNSPPYSLMNFEDQSQLQSQSQFQQLFSYNLFGNNLLNPININNINNNDESNESSPKVDDNSSVTSAITNKHNGRSRRSLALKSKTGSHSNCSNNNYISSASTI